MFCLVWLQRGRSYLKNLLFLEGYCPIYWSQVVCAVSELEGVGLLMILSALFWLRCAYMVLIEGSAMPIILSAVLITLYMTLSIFLLSTYTLNDNRLHLADAFIESDLQTRT